MATFETVEPGTIALIQQTPADKILKKYEDDNEYHFHEVDRKWIIEAMEEYAALPPTQS
jgi:hypothetical protein